MHADSVSLSHKKTVSGKRSATDDTLSYTVSESSAASGRRFAERTIIFPSRFDYALVVIGLQTGVRQLSFVFKQVEKYGGVMIFLSTLALTICISLPSMVQQMFYGFYNKYGFIKFWNMAPVAFGIGLSMALYSVYECISWSAMAGLLILQIGHIPFRGISDWTTCQKIKRPEGILCFDASSNWPNTSCELTTYPGYEFYNKIAYGPQNENSFNAPWFLCCVLVWLIVFVMVSQGFRRLKNILIKVPIICLLSFGLLVFFSFATQGGINEGGSDHLFNIDESPSRYTFVWLVWHAIRIVQISMGTLCQLGSYSPSDTPLLADSVMILIFSCFYNALFSYFAYCCHAWIGNTFTNIRTECLATEGMIALYSSIPTAISFLAMGNLWLFVYFAGFALKTIIQIVISLTATMNAMSEAFHLHRHRQQIVVVICTVSLLLNLPITMMHSGLFFHQTNRYVELIVDLFIVTFSGIIIVCLYDLERVFDDMHFFYNAEPVLFLKFISYLSPVLLVFFSVIGITNIVSKWPSHPAFTEHRWTGLFVGLSVVFLLLPIPAFALYIYIVNLMKRNISTILKPTRFWGPPETEIRRARSMFNPRFELRYKSKKPCAHNCLLNNLRIKIEVEKRDTQRKEFFQNVFRNPNYAEWDDDEEWKYGGDIIETARAIDWTGEIGTDHPIMTGGRRVLSLMAAVEKKEEQQQGENNEENKEGDINLEEDRKDDGKSKRDNVPINVALVKPFILPVDNFKESEMDLENDIILPDFIATELRPGIRHLQGISGEVTHRKPRSPRYTAAEHSAYRYRRKFKREKQVETFIEPPPTPKTYNRKDRTSSKGQWRSKSCQTDRGLKRLRNVVRAFLPTWKSNDRKKHRGVGTNSDGGPSAAYRKSPTSGVSSEDSETLSEIDEWP